MPTRDPTPDRTPDPARWIAQTMGEPALHAPASLLDLLNYQMHLVLSFSTADVIRLCERDFGITRHEWGYIGLLAVFGELAPSELALRSGMDRSRTSKALMPLLQKGLVQRRSEPHDRRRARVSLTPAGRRLHERMFPRVLAIHQRLLESFSAGEVKQLARLLHRLRRRAIELQAGQGAMRAAR